MSEEMKEKIIEKLFNLFKVKNFITILIFVVFAYLSITSKIDADKFMFILGMIATYYFTKPEKQISK